MLNTILNTNVSTGWTINGLGPVGDGNTIMVGSITEPGPDLFTFIGLFDKRGKLITKVEATERGGLNSFIIDACGNIIVAGWYYNDVTGVPNCLLIKFNPTLNCIISQLHYDEPQSSIFKELLESTYDNTLIAVGSQFSEPGVVEFIISKFDYDLKCLNTLMFKLEYITAQRVNVDVKSDGTIVLSYPIIERLGKDCIQRVNINPNLEIINVPEEVTK